MRRTKGRWGKKRKPHIRTVIRNNMTKYPLALRKRIEENRRVKKWWRI